MSVILHHTAWGKHQQAIFSSVREAADAALLIEEDDLGRAELITQNGIAIWDSLSLDEQLTLEELAK